MGGLLQGAFEAAHQGAWQDALLRRCAGTWSLPRTASLEMAATTVGVGGMQVGADGRVQLCRGRPS
jgi:hypothetical protein